MYRRFGAAALLTVATAAGSVGAAAAAPQSKAVPLRCGDHVTADVVLHNDLTCAGTALYLVIPQKGTVTVDLNGHRLKGNGTGTGLETQLFHLPGQINGSLVVSNGTITGFASAVAGPPQSSPGLINLTVRNLRLTSNGTWLPPAVQGTVLVDNSVITDSGSGRGRPDSQRFTVQNSQLIRSSISSGSETNNYLSRNYFSEGGFFSGFFSNVTAIGNEFRDCGTAVTVAQTDTYATRIEGNSFKHCQAGVRLEGGVFGPVTVKDNEFIENTVVGMTYLNAFNRDLRIVGNSFLRNTGDGLRGDDTRVGPGPAAGSGPTLISGNSTIGNTGWGIKATGVIRDGGDNFARRNGPPAQCSGVVCR